MKNSKSVLRILKLAIVGLWYCDKFAGWRIDNFLENVSDGGRESEVLVVWSDHIYKK